MSFAASRVILLILVFKLLHRVFSSRTGQFSLEGFFKEPVCLLREIFVRGMTEFEGSFGFSCAVRAVQGGLQALWFCCCRFCLLLCFVPLPSLSY